MDAEKLREYMILEGVSYINYIKIFAAIVVIASSTGLGLYMSNCCNLEIRQLKEFKKIIMLLKGEISYGNTTLPDAIAVLAKKENGVFKQFLVELEGKLNSLQGVRFQLMWEEAVDSSMGNTNLCKKHKEMIKALGKELGYMDKHTQLGCLDVFIYEINEEIKDKMLAVKDKVRIYNVIGVLFGVFVVIILA